MGATPENVVPERPRFKRSEGKVTYPGRKQVRRVLGAGGIVERDQLILDSEAGEGTPILARPQRRMHGPSACCRRAGLHDGATVLAVAPLFRAMTLASSSVEWPCLAA